MKDIAVTDSSIAEERTADFGIVEDVGEFENASGLLGRELREALVEFAVGLVELGGSLGIHRLTAPDTQRFASGCLPTATGTLERGDRVGFVFGDVDAVQPREFAIGVLGEDRDVPSRDLATPDPAVMLFDVSLVQVPRGEERSAGLPEVRQRDGLRDAGSVGGLVEDLRDHPIGDRLTLRDLTPEGRVVITPVGMGVEPAVDVRDRRDQHDRSAALLAFDGDLQAVVVVLDVADGEVLELPAAESGIELECDHRRVARVVTLVEHRLDVLVPLEHVPGVGRRVVVVRGARGDPVDRRGTLIVVGVGDALREDAKGGSVVPVRFLVVVAAVDPGDDRLRGVALLEGGRERLVVEFLRHDGAVTEEFLVTVVRVLLGEEIEPVAELEQEFSVDVGDLVAGFGALSERVDPAAWCRRHELLDSEDSHKSVALNLGFPALHRLKSSGSKPLPAGLETSCRNTSPSSPNLRFKAHSHSGVTGGVAA